MRDAGFESPTAIQIKAIPPALTGKDLVGQAKTGTGKTAAFSLPVLHRTAAGEGTSALILAPTRELAIQVRRAIEELARYSRLRIALIYGGVGFDGQLAALRAGAEVIVGTPGRVLDHYRRGTFRLDKIRIVVLDECDRMFDLGFRPDIERVLHATSPAREQLLLFSATVGKDVLQIAKRFMRDPEIVYTAPETLTVDNVEQFYTTVSPRRKTSLVAALVRRELNEGRLEQAIIFSRTKRGCDRLAKKLREMGLQAHPIHGDLSQPRREAVLRDVRNKKVRILVATDVAARGLDIDGISHVFNYDIPEYPEDYVHRIGRTARMGAKGTAYTLVAPGQGGFLTEIEKLTNVLVEPFELSGFDLGVEDAVPERAQGTGRILFNSAHRA